MVRRYRASAISCTGAATRAPSCCSAWSAEPNIDFAVATLARVAGMVPGAAEAVFAVARTAGWIAHASRPTQAAVRYVPALSTPARLRSSTHDAVAVCYRFVT